LLLLDVIDRLVLVGLEPVDGRLEATSSFNSEFCAFAWEAHVDEGI